jgi:hypothetical protein
MVSELTRTIHYRAQFVRVVVGVGMGRIEGAATSDDGDVEVLS